MKNLKNYTKAELISKINGLASNTTNSNNNTIFKIILKNLLYYKNILLKITLIALIIRILKRYSILRRLLTFSNWILITIFGISFMDIYGLESLTNILSYLRNTSVYTWFSSLLGMKVIETPSRLKQINSNSTGDKESNKIIERFTKIIHNEPEEIKDETPIYKNKYVIIGGILILSCLTWYFYDDLRPIGSSVLAWINTYRSRPDSDPHAPNGSIQESSKSTIQSLKDSLLNRFYKKDESPSKGSSPALSSIGLGQDTKGKSIDFNNLTQSEINRRGLLDPQPTGLRDITGNSFTAESSAVLNEIKTFTNYLESSSFPKTAIQIGLYNLLRERLLKLSETSETQYNQLIEDVDSNNLIENFLNLETELFKNIIPSPNAYDDVELTAIQERDVWSDKANTPQQVLSPLNIDENLNDSSGSDPYKFAVSNADRDHLLPSTNIELQNPEIILEHNSGSDNSLDRYFPKIETQTVEVTIQPVEVKTEENKSGFKSLFDQIRLKRNDKDVTATPNITNVGLQTPVHERLNPSPLIPKPSISNLFEETMNLFDDPIDIGIDTSGESSNKEEPKDEFIQESSNDIPTTERAALFKSINSRRLEYGSPVDNDKVAVEAKLTSEDSESSTDEIKDTVKDDFIQGSSNYLEDPWSNVKVEVYNGQIHERFVNIDLGNLNSKANKIFIMTNDGHSQFTTIKDNNPIKQIKWDNKGITNPQNNQLEVYKIYITDKDFINHDIYTNHDAKLLPSFWDNLNEDHKNNFSN
jgi:hypothetical protein